MSPCYNIAGEPDDTYQRCNTANTTAHSACCAIKKKFPDICLESGLCLATAARDLGSIYENGCTDIQGADNACPKACTKRKNTMFFYAQTPFWHPRVDVKAEC